MYRNLKRPFDILCVVITMPLWLPLMVVLAVLVKATSRGNVFFKQKRYGKNHTFFMIYKFRSMYSDTPKDVPTHLLQNPASYITPIGRFLRKSSLDELPQLLNVLKGDISLVGPRPALWNQDDLIAERDKYGANSVPVGITGWAQINGRDELPIPDKAALDGEYVKRFGFITDIKILILTVFCALAGKGVKEGGTGDR